MKKKYKLSKDGLESVETYLAEEEVVELKNDGWVIEEIK